MANEALTNIALLYSMAAISGSGGGDTPTPRGSVSVTVGTVYTVGPNEQAKVINIDGEFVKLGNHGSFLAGFNGVMPVSVDGQTIMPIPNILV